MRKTRILSVVLTLALVFTTVFAGTSSAFAGTAEAKAEPKAQIEKGFLKLDKPGIKTKASAVGVDTNLNCTNVLSTKTSTSAYKSMNMPVSTYWLTSVTPKYTGLMYLDVKVTGTVDDWDSIDVYYVVPGSVKMTDEGLNWQYYTYDNGDSEYVWYAFENERMQTEYEPIPVTGGQPYQILFIADSYNEETLKVQARAKAYTTINRSLSQGSDKWTLASGLNRSGVQGTTYFKVTPDRTGVMNVYLKEYGYSSCTGEVTLCNADKKIRSEKLMYPGSSLKFGVKKGKTYYLKVTNTCGTGDQFYKYGIKYTMSSGTDRAIGTKSKAKQIYRKSDATFSTFVAANENNSDWYKFKVTTARKTKITVKNQYMSSGYTTMRLYKSDGTLVKTLKIPAGYEGYIETTSKLAKGTYYVKITKSLKNSGKYSIRWTY